MLPGVASSLRPALLLAALMSTVLVLPERHDVVRLTALSAVTAPEVPAAPLLPIAPHAESPAAVPTLPAAAPGLPDLAAAARALELDELTDRTLRVVVGDANPDWIAISTGTAIAVSRDGGRRFRRLLAPGAAELPTIWFDRRGRLLVQSEDEVWTDARGQLVRAKGAQVPPVPAPTLDFDDDQDDTVRWRGTAGWEPVRGIPDGEVSLVDAPWPALHVAGGIYEVVAGVAEWRLAVPGPYENGDLINAVAIDRAGRVWLTEYTGGGDCDGNDRLVVVGVIDRRVSDQSGS